MTKKTPQQLNRTIVRKVRVTTSRDLTGLPPPVFPGSKRVSPPAVANAPATSDAPSSTEPTESEARAPSSAPGTAPNSEANKEHLTACAPKDFGSGPSRT